MDLYNLEKIFSLSKEPVQKERFNKWVQQEDVVPFLEEEIDDENIIIYASLPNVFIGSIVSASANKNRNGSSSIENFKSSVFLTIPSRLILCIAIANEAIA